jgi:hypothetical protein
MKETRTILSAIIMVVCVAGCNLETAVSKYQGDGSIRFVKGPLLGSDGVALSFDTFCISSNFDHTYTCGKIPVCNNHYVLYLSVEGSERLEFLDTATVSTSLIDSNGITIWNVETNLTPWTCTYGGGDTWVDYYYFVFDDTTGKLSGGSHFIPTEGITYRLSVSFRTNSFCSNRTNKAYFCLKAGGCK